MARVLVACEFSGVVREAFRKRGHDAWSCDLLPSLDNSPFHYQGHIREMLKEDWRLIADNHYGLPWDLVIAHPPCTYLAVSGARWWKDRGQEQHDAYRFAVEFTNVANRVCIENPIGYLSTAWRKPDQIVQPWMFGHGETKATCLWLKNLPKLQPTKIVEGRRPRVHHESPGVVNGLTRQQRRSITYQGIAEAMAEQWGSGFSTQG
jgi:hypothetical protein